MLSALVIAVALTATDPVCSEVPVGPIGSPTEDLARVAELTGAAPVRSQLFRRWSDTPSVTICDGERAPHPSQVPVPALPTSLQLDVLPLTWQSYLETGYSDDRNDGALWRGRGFSTEATGGARLRWKWFSAAAAPVVAWQQNRNFYYPVNMQPGYSPYANPFASGIDLPLHYGPSAFWTFDPGPSYARVDVFNVGAGFSTENLWWGPGIRNSIIMSNSGPGMPHLFLGTSKPQDIWIGWLEAQLMWGWPSQSKWLFPDGHTDSRLFTALTVGYEPKWVPGLHIGFARVFLQVIPPGGLPLNDYFKMFTTLSGGSNNGSENQLGSIFFRWAMPEAGFEFFGEWGKDDFWADFRDLMTQPEHDAAYMLGFQKVFPVGSHWLRFHAELTNTLSKPTAKEDPGRGTPIFYTHGAELAGYTVGGQMLGAGVGPQANTQFVAADYFHDRGRIGVWFERVLRNGSYFWRNYGSIEGEDTEVIAGAHGVWSWSEVDVDLSAAYAHRYNMNFMVWDTSAFKGMLAVTWWPGRVQPMRLPAPIGKR